MVNNMSLSPTKHFTKRCRERAGINKKSVGRFLENASKDSVNVSSLTGRYRKIVEDILKDKSLIEKSLIYDKYMILADTQEKAITLLPLPKDLVRRCRSLKDKSRMS